jgi:hypothetical protein
MKGDANAAVYRRAKTGLSQGENGFIAGRKQVDRGAESRLRFRHVPGLTESVSLILSEPLGAGDAIVVTGSSNCSPLALSTSTTLALTIRFL